MRLQKEMFSASGSLSVLLPILISFLGGYRS
jgi:hypothetical protein